MTDPSGMFWREEQSSLESEIQRYGMFNETHADIFHGALKVEATGFWLIVAVRFHIETRVSEENEEYFAEKKWDGTGEQITRTI